MGNSLRLCGKVLLFTLFSAGAGIGGKAGLYEAGRARARLMRIASSDRFDAPMARHELKYFSEIKYAAYGGSIGGITALVIYGLYRERKNASE